jgi:acyl-CoA thioesterase II
VAALGASTSDGPIIHVCAAPYVSDLFLLAAALPPHGIVIESPDVQVASLDHAVWFHADFRADDWVLDDQEVLWAGGSRALCRGLLYDRHGRLVATVMQEGLVRTPPQDLSVAVGSRAQE